MNRENKKSSVADLHRNKILKTSEKLFLEKGFSQTTISDISNASEYSRRTIYSYYLSKEDILHNIIAKALEKLKLDIEKTLDGKNGFIAQYMDICNAIYNYQTNSPIAFESIEKNSTDKIDLNNVSPAVKKIFSLGSEINELLSLYIQKGISQGLVYEDILPMQTVYILYSSISSAIALVQSKGDFISKTFLMTKEEFLNYSFKQIINGILINHIN